MANGNCKLDFFETFDSFRNPQKVRKESISVCKTEYLID